MKSSIVADLCSRTPLFLSALFFCFPLGCGDVVQNESVSSEDVQPSFSGGSGVPEGNLSLRFPDAVLGGSQLAGEDTQETSDAIDSGEPEAEQDTDAMGCEPLCDGKSCGDNGCGGVCGYCGAGTFCKNGACVGSDCAPECAGKSCGDDGCGGQCGVCTNGENCIDGTCETGPCEPSCESKTCGDDGCGGSCGTCEEGQTCVEGGCESEPLECLPDCVDKTCGDDGCGGVCGECEEMEMCNDSGLCEEIPVDCVPMCLGKECGPDGCGGFCGSCDEGKDCFDGVCVCSLCEPGAVQEMNGDSCEQCGVWLMQSVCQDDCSWSEWENKQCANQGECSPGDQEFSDSVKCGNCGMAATVRTCGNGCTWDPWENGLCEGEGECSPGAEEFAKSAACGNCGFTESSKVCSEVCQWSDFSIPVCIEEGVSCLPGAEQTEPCGNCGTRTKTCGDGCAFGPWSACEGEGECSPGETECQFTDFGMFGSGFLPFKCTDQCVFVFDDQTSGICAEGNDGGTESEEGGTGPSASCAGNCGVQSLPLSNGTTCSCSVKCEVAGNCCPDVCEECGFCGAGGGEGQEELNEEEAEQLK